MNSNAIHNKFSEQCLDGQCFLWIVLESIIPLNFFLTFSWNVGMIIEYPNFVWRAHKT